MAYEMNGPRIVAGDQITGDHMEKCDCAVTITMTPPLIKLWRRCKLDSPLSINQGHRPRPKRRLTMHRVSIQTQTACAVMTVYLILILGRANGLFPVKFARASTILA
jgi:hypothetical protein